MIKKSPTKPEMAWLPWNALELVARVENHGAQKYERFGWREKTVNDHLNAALRHISAHQQGRWDDDEEPGHSGLPHLAHAACRLLFALAQEEDWRVGKHPKTKRKR